MRSLTLGLYYNTLQFVDRTRSDLEEQDARHCFHVHIFNLILIYFYYLKIEALLHWTNHRLDADVAFSCLHMLHKVDVSPLE